MCGRFVSASPPDEIARYFGAVPPDEVLIDPSFNVAPTDDVHAVVQRDHVRRLDAFHWGLVPRSAEDPKRGGRLINARGESLRTTWPFAQSFRRRRCIVAADGFYEWQVVEGLTRKQPMYIHRADGALLAFAGLWDSWQDPHEPGAPPLRSCTIITTAANEALAPVHDRMPVILGPERWDQWLDPDQCDTDELSALLVPVADDLLEMYPVSLDVNNVRNDGANLVDRVDPTRSSGPVQGTLL